MQRDLSITIGVIGFIVVVAILIFANNTGNGLSLSESNNIPTGFILGATATDEPTATPLPTMTTTPPLIKSPTPTVSTSVTPSPTTKVTSTTTPTPAQIAKCTSNSSYQKAKLLANQFMSKHKIKAGYEVLKLISTPESDDDIEAYSYWMGEDDPSKTIQLYQTVSTSYTTVSYSLDPGLIDKGNHTEIRGTRRCEMTLHEKRSTTDTEGVAHDEDLRLFLDFSLSEDGNLLLTAFKDSSNGTKYSGFD